MKALGIIARKELASYVSSPTAYIVAAVFLALGGASFALYLAGTGYADTSIKGFVVAGQYIMMLFAAMLTMRLIAEERKQGTWELLLNAPARDYEIILGKFAGSLAALTGMLLLTLYYPLLLIVLGDPDLGPIGTSYLGLFLMGCASLAVGVFASSLTSNQIVSAVLAAGILLGLWFLGTAADLAPGPLGEALAAVSLSYHFPGFVRGVVDTRAVVYYLSITALFLYLATRSVETARWR